MQIQVGSTQPENFRTDILVLGVYGRGGRRSPAFQTVNQAIGGGLATLLKLQDWKGKPGEFACFPAPEGLRARLLAIGSLGDRGSSPCNAVRKLAAHTGSMAGRAGVSRVAFFLDCAMDKRAVLDRPTVQAVGEGLEHGAYRFDRYKEKGTKASGADSVFLYFEGRRDRPVLATALERGLLVGRAQNIARDLVNEPANVIHPESLRDFALNLAKEKGLEVQVLDKKACEKRGMNAFLAVARGSSTEPSLVHLTYRPKKKASKRIVLVGKALTFDSGGMCIKTAAGQATMKMDMGGSAAVIGAMAGVADLEPDAEVHGIFAATENMTGASAYHTGDVLTASNGKTIEVLNTDAEGRLTLADALVYACELKPDALVDMATLTGACMVALGPTVAGIMGTGRSLIRELRGAGDRAGEAIWELPMPVEYKELIQSKIADVKNIGGRYGGAITAGMFLQEFVDEKVPWAHIDIAGPAYMDKPFAGQPHGGTGFPVRTLLEWISHG